MDMKCACGYATLYDLTDVVTTNDGTRHAATRCVATDRGCEWCGGTLSRRYRESLGDWLKRRFCSLSCRSRMNACKSDTYEDLAWLMDNGTPIYEALRRCGIPTAEAAYQWAIRHDALALARRVRPAYNTEIAARHREQRARRKETV